MAVILQCSCSNDFQDRRYGKGNRVFNELQGKSGGSRCTVCATKKEGK